MSTGAVIVVVGASGGIGASALAAAVAVRAKQAGLDPVAVDLRPFGGGLDVTLGAEQEAGVRWADLLGLTGAADAAALLGRLPQAEGVRVLSFGREDREAPDVGVVVEVLRALSASERLLVVDVAIDGAFIEPVVELATQIVVVAGSDLHGLAALSVTGRWLESRCRNVVVCLRGDRRVDEVATLVESAMGLTVVGLLVDDPTLRADLVHGVAPGARGRGVVAGVADRCLAEAVVGTRAGVAEAK